jgi:ubiquinone/menaquinone biosynthesis C-methylase UbiE
MRQDAMNTIESNDHSYWNNVYSKFHNAKPKRKSVWNERPTRFFVRLIPFLKYKGMKTIIDAGCGDGRNLGPFIKAGFDVTGVDYSNVALKKCRDNFMEAKNLTLIKSGLDKIPLPDESVDVIICDHVFVHIMVMKPVLERFHRLLGKDGYALLEFSSSKDPTHTKGEKISKNEFLQNGVYLRYDDPDDFHRMLSKFNILCFTSEYYTDPPHGSGYIRKKRHLHHSYFVVARK